MKKLFLLLSIVVLQFLIAYIGLSVYYRNAFVYGTWINNIYCTGKSIEEVNTELSGQFSYDGITIYDKEQNEYQIMAQDIDYQYDFELNAYYINSICSYMSDLTASKKLSVPTEDLNNYGFADPVVLTCYDNTNTAYTLYIGDATATEEYYYAMLPDDATVYEIEFNTADVLHGGMAYLKSPYMIKYYDVNISDVILEHDSEIIFNISNTSGAWEMLNPIENSQVNSSNINSFLTSLSRLEIESFVSMVEDGSDLIQYHLDDPAYRLTVKSTDNETTTIDFAEFDKKDGSVYLVYE